MAQSEQVQAVWNRAAEQAKRAAVAPSFYRAIERIVPIAWENGTFVIGLDASADGSLHVALNSGENQLKIEAALRAASGEATLRLRVIEGTAASDWEAAKARDAALAAQEARASERRAVTVNAAAASWDTVYDQVSKLWAEAEFRNMSSGRGRFLVAAMDVVDRALETVGVNGEAEERSFSRVLDRIASSVNADPALFAAVFFDRRARRGL